MLSIGEFSKISNVTTNALRYYDEIGLIKPAGVNSENGYRYYHVAQLQTILLINKLKTYHLTLEEISEILQNQGDNCLLLPLLQQKRQAMQKTLHNLTDTLHQMDQDILNLERGNHILANMDKIEVQRKETEAQNILFVRKMMSTKDYALYLAQLYQTIESRKLTIMGSPITVLHQEEDFNPECYDNEIAIPVKEAVEGTRVLPGGVCAMVRLHGPYTELPFVYAKLQEWVEKEGCVLAAEPYEVYLTDPNVTAAEENVTEVYLPIK